MTPQDRGRYETLFPQYAKPDGFVYGQEAVALFMKSGVNQTVLREIWNMVDTPVDNRLDPLEFAMAMHLIVCISKKNLPLPKGTLPHSLKVLKSQQTAPPNLLSPRVHLYSSSSSHSQCRPVGISSSSRRQRESLLRLQSVRV
jgi:hypothetical protein